MVLIAFASAFVVLLGLQFLPWQTVGAKIPVGVDVDPDILNLEMQGRWVTVYVEPFDGYKASDINISTVKLNGVLPSEQWKVQDDALMMKFKAEDVINLIWSEIYHMTKPMPQDNVIVELTVIGEFYDKTAFEGNDEMQVIAPSP